MADGVVRAFLPRSQHTLSVAVVTAAAREARHCHGLKMGSSVVLAEAMAGAILLASLQKDTVRINLQVECDGPLRGLLVDAGSDGSVRGYVKNQYLEALGAPGPFRFRAVLGNGGYLSVLRDRGDGEPYRSSVELQALSLEGDLNRYFAVSDQVETKIVLAVSELPGEPLGVVAGALLQALPGGDVGALRAEGEGLQKALFELLARDPNASAESLVLALAAESGEVTVRQEVAYRCSCSKERVLSLLRAMGRAELEGLIAEQHGAAVTCQFCGRRHQATEAELRAMLDEPQ